MQTILWTNLKKVVLIDQMCKLKKSKPKKCKINTARSAELPGLPLGFTLGPSTQRTYESPAFSAARYPPGQVSRPCVGSRAHGTPCTATLAPYFGQLPQASGRAIHPKGGACCPPRLVHVLSGAQPKNPCPRPASNSKLCPVNGRMLTDLTALAPIAPAKKTDYEGNGKGPLEGRGERTIGRKCEGEEN